MPPCAAVRPALCALVLVAACGGDDRPPLELEVGCQPLLGGHDCRAPFPSDFFRIADGATRTGFRVATEGAASLSTDSGGDADVHHFFTFDGFSATPTIVAALPSELIADGLVPLAGPAADSTVAASPTVLIDAETGELVPHYVDLDPRAVDLTRQAIVIHPLVGLRAETRYVVALHGVRRPGGAAAPAAEGFRRLRDREADAEPTLIPLIAHFDDDVFPVLEAAGLARGELQLAWDFTVGSHEAAVADLLAVRAGTLAWLDENSPTVVIDEVEETLAGTTWRTVRGTLTGPRFLDSDEPDAILTRDAAGAPTLAGETTFEFVAKVPASVRDRLAPGRALGYGHGFFGNLAEVDSDKTVGVFDATGSVGFAAVWLGMSSSDLATVVGALSAEPGRALRLGDRVDQAMANWIVLAAAVRGPLAELDELKRPLTAGVPGVVDDGAGGDNAGDLLYDPATLDYFGISQGHILGATMAAVNPAIRRVALQVGGAGFTHMMFRANPFEAFLVVLGGVVEDALDQQVLVATLQPAFDRFDPASFARYLVEQPLDGTPADRRALLQIGLGDVSVPNLGSFLHARLLGLPVVTPSPAEPFGLPPVAAPHDGSGLALYDFGIDPAIYDQARPSGEDNQVHEGLRLVPAALEQLDRFLDTGVIEHTCDAICDPD